VSRRVLFVPSRAATVAARDTEQQHWSSLCSQDHGRASGRTRRLEHEPRKSKRRHHRADARDDLLTEKKQEPPPSRETLRACGSGKWHRPLRWHARPGSGTAAHLSVHVR
jgi:hypothetical protein